MGHVFHGMAFSLIYLFLYRLTPLNVLCSKLSQLQVFHRKFMVHGISFRLRGDVDS